MEADSGNIQPGIEIESGMHSCPTAPASCTCKLEMDGQQCGGEIAEQMLGLLQGLTSNVGCTTQPST